MECRRKQPTLSKSLTLHHMSNVSKLEPGTSVVGKEYSILPLEKNIQLLVHESMVAIPVGSSYGELQTSQTQVFFSRRDL
jgi:hypothetical protein